MSNVVTRHSGVRLSASLRAAITLESRYGFQTLFDACAECRLEVIADVIETSSDCRDFLKTLDGVPLIEVLPKLAETLPAHILALAGINPEQRAQQTAQHRRRNHAIRRLLARACSASAPDG